MQSVEKQQKFIRLPEVANRTGLSQAKIYDAMADGKFPLSVTLGPNSRAWVEAEVDAWIAGRIVARDNKSDGEWRTIHPGIGKGRPRKAIAADPEPEEAADAA